MIIHPFLFCIIMIMIMIMIIIIIILLRVVGGAGFNPSWHRARGRLHPGQVARVNIQRQTRSLLAVATVITPTLLLKYIIIMTIHFSVIK